MNVEDGRPYSTDQIEQVVLVVSMSVHVTRTAHGKLDDLELITANRVGVSRPGPRNH
jgi:hypothetical protein